jgi:quinoprotein glucose dehydrogenase
MKRKFSGVALAICALGCTLSVSAQSGAKNGEWRSYGGDLGNTHYSPLDQINADNFQ